jgi:hypothetical protein
MTNVGLIIVVFFHSIYFQNQDNKCSSSSWFFFVTTFETKMTRVAHHCGFFALCKPLNQDNELFFFITSNSKMTSIVHCLDFFSCVATSKTTMTNIGLIVLIFFSFHLLLKPRQRAQLLILFFWLDLLKPWWHCGFFSLSKPLNHDNKL